MPERATGPDAGSKDYIQLDALAESIGEEPGRYLDGPLPATPRIQGLQTLQEIRGWRAAERKIARIRNRSPRENVMAELDERQEYLEGVDEDPPAYGERDVPEKNWLLNGEPWGEVDRRVAGASLRRGGLTQDTAVTDGGEEQ